MMAFVRRRVVTSLVVLCLVTFAGSVGGQNYPSTGTQSPSTSPESYIQYLFSVDVALSDTDIPVTLGIRDGETVAQVYTYSAFTK